MPCFNRYLLQDGENSDDNDGGPADQISDEEEVHTIILLLNLLCIFQY